MWYMAVRLKVEGLVPPSVQYEAGMDWQVDRAQCTTTQATAAFKA
jgi:hypothetical protein